MSQQLTSGWLGTNPQIVGEPTAASMTQSLALRQGQEGAACDVIQILVASVQCGRQPGWKAR